MHELLASLNERQRIAAETTDGPVLILAGAGSGKTKTLIHRIAYIIATGKAKPWNILSVTFTNKAAGEMKERLSKLLAGKVEKLPVTGTFHSICVQILRREIELLEYNKNFVIYDADDSATLVKKVMKDIGIDTKKVSPKTIQYIISSAKNNLQGPSEFEAEAGDFMEETAARVYTMYQRELESNSGLDFDDLIRLVVKLFRTHPEVLERYQAAFPYIMVDEYQDTNHAQYELVTMLAAKHKNLCVVGDDFQSIYSWRGANMQNILDFEKDYPDAQVVLLEQNYRSTQRILEAANEIIKYNTKQKDKTLWTENERGNLITIAQVADEKSEGEYILRAIFMPEEAVSETPTEADEIEYIDEEAVQESVLDKIMRSGSFETHKQQQGLQEAVHKLKYKTDLSRFVVLYRTNAQSRAIEEACISYNVPYRLVGGLRFYDRREIKDVIAYVRCVVNPHDWISAERISNVPARSLGARSWQKVEEKCRELGVSYLDIQPADLPVMREQQRNAFLGFQAMMNDIQTKIETLTPSEALQLVVKRSGYQDQFDIRVPEEEKRLENIKELFSVTKKFDNQVGTEGLNACLEEVALMSDLDEVKENEQAITLMTVHAAKGLEFDTVFVTGMEEGLFPHSRSLFEPNEMEEERRLCYVALTRAKKAAHLIWAAQRTVYGDTRISSPSRFLNDIPEHLVNNV